MTEHLGKAESVLRQMAYREIEERDIGRLREELAGARRIIGALVIQAGGEVEASDGLLLDDYELERVDVPEHRAFRLKARRVGAARPIA